jgi:ABC-type nitrate/sulfonate/bicarbonate transport system substrate-binding protein
MKKTIIALAVILALGIVIFFFFHKKKISIPAKTASTDNVIRFAYLSTQDQQTLIVDLAQDKGFFQRNNANVELIPTQANTDALLSSGSADAEIIGLPDTLALYLNDMEPRSIAHIMNAASYGVSRFPKDQASSIKTAALTRLGGMPQAMTQVALKNIGANQQNIDMVAAPSDANKIDLLEKGTVDFTLIVSIKNIFNPDFPKNFTVYPANEILNDPSLVSDLVAYQKTINQKPQQLQALTNALYETMAYIKNNPEEIKSYFQNKYGYTPELSEKLYSQFMGAQTRDFVPTIQDAQTILKEVQDMYKPTDPTRDITGFINPTFAKKAASVSAN